MKKLTAGDHQLRSDQFKEWDQVIKRWADKKWPELKDLKSPGIRRFQRTRHAVLRWLELIFPELKPPPADAHPAPPEGAGNRTVNGMSGPGHDLIAGRRTAKKRYGEDLAAKWGQTVHGAISAEMVGDYVPKLGYDVRVVLADGRQLHIEAKATAGSGDTVAIEDGERGHNQDSGCQHEHALFVVRDVKSTMVDGEWKCYGGTPEVALGWRIAWSDLTPQPNWLYKVPQTMPVQIPGMPETAADVSQPK